MDNKERFISLCKKVNRPGMDELMQWLEDNKFYTSPASTKYHGAYDGGLLDHSLNVYDELNRLLSAYPEINASEESKMNPGVWEVQDNVKYGYGLLQWTKGSDFLKWAGLDVASTNRLVRINPQELMDLQLEYLLYSSSKSCPSEDKRWYATTKYESPYSMSYETYIKSTYTPEEMALVFHASYERSAGDHERRMARAKSARAWYNFLLKNI